MDFFAQQDNARKHTKLLLILFSLAIVFVIAALYFIILLAFKHYSPSPPLTYWIPELFLAVSVPTILIIIGSTFYKLVSLRAGGSVVAKSLGAIEINRNTSDIKEQALINVVEEMSIASGVTMPDIFIIEEPSINAFAAGFTIHDAAIGITRGAINTLNRDELQAVVAHEFSHILNGDMRLNIQLLGPLFGLLVISFLGRMLLFSSASSNNSSSSGRKSSGGVLIFVGLAIMIVGAIGLFFGKLIQAAISRQREFLADASAVQFTRNPYGILGVLKNIGYDNFSEISNPHASDTAHFFFAQPFKNKLLDYFDIEPLSTHPSISKRIKAIDPNWNGNFDPPRPTVNIDTSKDETTSPNKTNTTSLNPVTAIAVTALIGTINDSNIQKAQSDCSNIKNHLNSYLQDPIKSLHLLYLLVSNNITRILSISNSLDQTLLEETLNLVNKLTLTQKFDTILILLPLIKKLDKSYLRKLPDHLILITLSTEDPFSILICRVVLNELSFSLNPKSKNSLSNNYKKFSQSINVLFTYLAYLDINSECPTKDAESALLWSDYPDCIKPLSFKPSLIDLDNALEHLLQSSFSIRKSILDTCSTIILSDGYISEQENVTIRLISLVLDCPIPEIIS